MPAMLAKLKLCGVRGDGTEVEVESGLPDRAMLAPLLPPRLIEVVVASAPTASRFFPPSITCQRGHAVYLLC
jgi:hypothetical protein